MMRQILSPVESIWLVSSQLFCRPRLNMHLQGKPFVAVLPNYRLGTLGFLARSDYPSQGT
jgi:carboxylesterase type B